MQPYLFFKGSHGKPCFIKYLVGFLLALTLHNTTFAKTGPLWRKLLNPIHLNMSVGYGITSYRNTIADMQIFEKDGKLYLYNPKEKHILYLVRWFGKPYVRLKTYEDLSQFLNASSKEKKSFKAVGNTFPISLSGHVDIFKKFSLELGGSVFINKVKTLKPDAKHEHLGDYEDPDGMHYIIRPFARLGFKLLENAAYTLLLSSQIGFEWMYARLSDSLAVHRSELPPVALSLTVKKHISEYFSTFGRLTYDTRSLIDLFGKSNSGSSLLKQQGVFFELGVSINCPELPRCPVPNCEIKIKHKHLGKPYRGVSMFTGKDAKGTRLYKH